MTTITQTTLDKLQQFDTPTICNIIELFGVRPQTQGYMNDRIRACFPEMPPVVGFASTATVRSATSPGETNYGSLTEQVRRFPELSGQAVVVFQDLDDPHIAATFGEVMCTTYKAFGAVGLVTSGAGRDLDQVRAIDFPIFTDGTICSHGYFHIVDIHVPVNVGGIVVQPDTLIHADLNGVTTIPTEIAAEVADIGEEFMDCETVLFEAMRDGTPALEKLEAARVEMHNRVDKLKARVSRRQQG